jgi:hypothetical protein
MIEQKLYQEYVKNTAPKSPMMRSIIAAFLVYWILSYLARLVAMPLYYCRVSEKHIEELEQYWRRLCDEEGTEPAPAPEAVQPVVFSRNSETSEDTDSYLC